MSSLDHLRRNLPRAETPPYINRFNHLPYYVHTSVEREQLPVAYPAKYRMTAVQSYVVPVQVCCADVLVLGTEDDDRHGSDIKTSRQDVLNSRRQGASYAYL